MSMRQLGCAARQHGGAALSLNLLSPAHAAARCDAICQKRQRSSGPEALSATRYSCAARQPPSRRASGRPQRVSIQQGSVRHIAGGSALLRAQPLARVSARRRQRQAAKASADRQRTASDVTLWAGDAIVLLLTQMSSDRLPMENQGLTSILLLTAWTAVAGAKRDYELGSADYDFWNVRAPVLSAIRSAALTWALFAPLAVAMYGRLASQHLLKVPADAAPQLPPVPGFGAAPMWLLPPAAADTSQLLAPELEVIIAALFCVGAWRGLYSAYRTWSNFR